MKTFNITITSKNKHSMSDLCFFFEKNKTFNLIKKHFKKKRKKRRLTLLTSPHVNKSAQEHFEKRLVKRQFTLKIPENLKYFLFLKKLTSNLFPDIHFKLKHLINNKEIKIIGLKIFNPNHYKINRYSNFKKCNLIHQEQLKLKRESFKKKINFILQIYDVYGEISKNKSK